jgi:Flp pilus assembly protein TadD
VPQESSTLADHAEWRRSLWVGVALFLLAIAPYWQTSHFLFVNWDDGVYVAENPVVQRGLTGSNLRWAFMSTTTGNWHPITWLSHMLDCQLFGLRPEGHHLVNAVLHGLNSLLVFLLLRSMTGLVWRSALVAALFAVHPLHVESVAWIAERKDLLSTLFGLSALYAYSGYVSSPSLWRYALVAGFFGLSLMSKAMWVTFPLLLFLLDVWPLRRCTATGPQATGNVPLRAIVLEKLPLLAMSAAVSWVTMRAQDAGGALASIDALPVSQRMANAVVAYAAYLCKTIWPTNLSAIYPLREQLSPMEIGLSAAVIGGLTIGVCVLGRRRLWLPVGWFWFLGMLVPVIGLVHVGSHAMADRYTYVPLIGIFVMIAWSLPATDLNVAKGRVTVALTALILAGLTAATFVQVRVWENTTTLFQHAVKVTNGNYLAHNLLAGEFAKRGDFVGARRQLDAALQIRSNYAGAHYNLGILSLRQHDYPVARDHLEQAVNSSPKDPTIWNALGVAMLNLKRYDSAATNLRRALELNPDYPEAAANLGSVFLAQGKNFESIEQCEIALALRPDLADAHATLAAAQWNIGRRDDAMAHNRIAVQLNPNLPNPRLNLGIGLLTRGDFDEAIVHLEHVLRLIPNHDVAEKALAAARKGRDRAKNSK